MNNTKKKTIVIVVVSLAVVAIIAIAGVLIHHFAFPKEEKEFVTKIKIENFYDGSDFVEYVEEQIQYEFPQERTVIVHATVPTVNPFYYALFPTAINTYEASVVLSIKDLDEDEIEKIEKQLAEDERFSESLGDLKVLIGSPPGTNLYEYKLVYLLDTEEFNTMPDKTGVYSLITVFYDSDMKQFTIERFNNKYWKIER